MTSLSAQQWTPEDVEVAARAFVHGESPPLEMLKRLGPTPPHAFMRAIERRVAELVEGWVDDMSEPS